MCLGACVGPSGGGCCVWQHHQRRPLRVRARHYHGGIGGWRKADNESLRIRFVVLTISSAYEMNGALPALSFSRPSFSCARLLASLPGAVNGLLPVPPTFSIFNESLRPPVYLLAYNS